MKTKILLVIVAVILIPGMIYFIQDRKSSEERLEYSEVIEPEEKTEEISGISEETFLSFEDNSLEGARKEGEEIADEPKTETLPEGDEAVVKKETEPNELVQCLADAGVVIYGSATCPACAQLVASLGGYDAIEPIYVECTKEGQRCQREMQTNYVPEIQIKGALYNGSRAPEALADETGCEL